MFDQIIRFRTGPLEYRSPEMLIVPRQAANAYKIHGIRRFVCAI